MKDKVLEIFNQVSFRKFSCAFRKHVDPLFARAYNEKRVGGRVDNNFSWEDCASYIIGDGDYYITEEQFNNFINESKK